MPASQEKQPDQRQLIAALAIECHLPVDEMTTLYEHERAKLAAGVPVVLVRRDAETSDIAALESATGLLTQRGARTSRAAVVARQLGKVCLVGCSELEIDEGARTIRIVETTLHEGDTITLDGYDGVLYAGAAKIEKQYQEELIARLGALRLRAPKP